MDITITFADGTAHTYKNAPDGTTPEQATQLAKEQFGKEVVKLDGGAKESSAAEIGRVADKSIRKGLTAFPGIVGDLSLFAGRNEHVRQSLPPQMRLPMEAARKLLPGLDDAVQATKFGDVQDRLETGLGVLPPVSQPKTETGKATANVLEAMISTMAGGGPGTLMQKAGVGAASGAGGEVGARVLGDDHPLGRLIGSLGGGGLAAWFQSAVPNAQKLVKQGTEFMTKEDWAKAKVLESTLNDAKVPHLKSQLLGDKSTLDDVVAAASGSPSAKPKLGIATRGAPKASQNALETWTMENLPTAGPNNRSEVLTDVQAAADKALKSISKKSNAAFEAAMPDSKLEYTPERIKNLRDSLITLANSERFGSTSDGGKAILKLADDLIAERAQTWVLPAAKNERDLIRRFGQPMTSELEVNNILERGGKVFYQSEMDGSIAALKDVSQLRGKSVTDMIGVPPVPSGSKDKLVTNAHKVNNLIKDLNSKINDPLNLDYKHLPALDVKKIMKEATPEFDAARTAKREIIEKELNPAKQGLTGQIAQMGGGPKESKLTAKDAALGMIFNPTQPQGGAIREMGKTMGGDQVGELLREHIHKTMQSVLRDGDKSPRKFVHALYESPAQKENIEAALEVAAKHYNRNPEATKIGFRRLMEGLESFQDMKLASGVSPGATANVAGSNFFSKIIRPVTSFGREQDQRAITGTYNKIADLVTSKDGLSKLHAIATAKDPVVLQQLLVGVLTATNQQSD